MLSVKLRTLEERYNHYTSHICTLLARSNLQSCRSPVAECWKNGPFHDKTIDTEHLRYDLIDLSFDVWCTYIVNNILVKKTSSTTSPLTHTRAMYNPNKPRITIKCPPLLFPQVSNFPNHSASLQSSHDLKTQPDPYSPQAIDSDLHPGPITRQHPFHPRREEK